MSSEKSQKLNLLLKNWQAGTVMVHAQLEKMGIYQQLVDRYVKSNWLEPIGRGAFKKAGDKIDWSGALFTLQTQLGLSVHVGGKTAMELSDYTHFVHLRTAGIVWLFGKKGENLPNWFISDSEHKWNREIKYLTPNLFQNVEAAIGLKKIRIGHSARDYKIVISSLERAILELLYLIPSQQTLEEAKYLMEGLMTLRPKLLQQLLENCHSIKVKRLFLFLAEFCHLPCVKHLNFSKINLGRGKRVIGKGGNFIKKYLISIPDVFVNTFKEEFENYE